MEDFYMEENYFLRKGGIYNNLIYSISKNGDESTYTFYTDVRIGASAGDNQLSADVKKYGAERASDEEISDAFIDSLSKKICLDVKLGSQQYIECMKTLPKEFFTEENCETIMRNISKQFKNTDKKVQATSEIAIEDLKKHVNLLGPQNNNMGKGH